jgi:hypothetical protein
MAVFDDPSPTRRWKNVATVGNAGKFAVSVEKIVTARADYANMVNLGAMPPPLTAAFWCRFRAIPAVSATRGCPSLGV